MEQTWRWFGPDDVVRLAHDPSGRGDRHRHRAAPDPLRRGLERRGDRGAQGDDRGRSVARPALERGREPAGPRARSRSAKAISSRCSRTTASRCATSRACGVDHDLLQLHAGARLDAHGARAIRCPAAARRCASTRTSSRPSTASCWSAPAPRRTTRPRSLSAGRAWFDARVREPTGDSSSPTSWPACRAPSTATTSPACAACSPATGT